QSVSIVVHAGGGVERARGRELCQRAECDVVREQVAEGDDRTVTLIEQTGSAFELALPFENALVWSDAVTVRFAVVGRLGQRVADRGVYPLIAAKADLGLQAVVIGDAEVRQHVDLAHLAICRQDWTGGVGTRHILCIDGTVGKVASGGDGGGKTT